MIRAARRAALLVVLAILAAASISCSEIEQAVRGSGLSEDRGARVSPGAAGKALKELEVAPPGSTSGYDREAFPHWSDAREFGWRVSDDACDAREAALMRDGKDVVVGEGCDVTSGRWLDPYTKQTFTDPLDIDIDHFVPLANAYRSGASGWGETERERYANDPDNLLSVEDNANQEKGDKGPEAWKPPNRAIWCSYAKGWISVKSGYSLAINPQERASLRQMLSTCENQ